jgi:Zn-dependent peptidase ImmA (M78 family)/transcriptional regulator with XRE-family HTH domain
MIGERIRLAREACRLTQAELAELSGLEQNTLSDYELGVILSPAADAVARIAAATQFPERFFWRGPLPDLPDGHYRKLKRGTTKVAKQVRAQVRQVVEVVQISHDVVNLPLVRLEPVRGEKLSLSEVEQAAADARVRVGVGQRDPIPNVMRAVERSGVVVVGLPMEMEDHDGFSAWPEFGNPELGRPVIAFTNGAAGDRMRFTVSHEFGHLLLHTLRPFITPDLAEQEANRFAGAFLLPEEAALESLRPPVTLTTLMGIKATHGVSIAMAAQRALDLQIIDRPHFVSLRKQISARGWTKVEPIEVIPESPLLLAKLLGIVGGKGSIAQRADRAALPMFTFNTWSQMPESHAIRA